MSACDNFHKTVPSSWHCQACQRQSDDGCIGPNLSYRDCR